MTGHPTAPAFAELVAENAALHRQLAELHSTAARALDGRMEADGRERATKARLVATEAAVNRVRDVLAVNRSVSAEPDSLFEDDERAALAWRMAWRACRDLFARDLEVALDGPPPAGSG